MTYYIWNGSNGDFGNAADWSGGVVPGVGDHAVIFSGTVSATGTEAALPGIVLGKYALSLEPVLKLQHAVVNDITLVSDAPVPDADGYQSIDVAGRVVFTGTVEGSYELENHLAISIARNGLMVNLGTISNQGPEVSGTTTITGAEGARLLNQGSIVAYQGMTTIDANVSGTGTLQILGSSLPNNLEVDSILELGGTVAHAQHVAFSGQATAPAYLELSLDAPARFHGIIDGFAGSDEIVVGGITASAASFAHGVLRLSDGMQDVANLRLSGSYASSDFQLAQVNGNTVVTLAHQPANA